MSEIHIPENAGEYAEGLKKILRRFGEEWPAYIACGPGWYPILVDLDQKLNEVAPHYELAQVKEKYGGLRFYVELPEERGALGIWEARNPMPLGTDNPEAEDWWRRLDEWEASPEGKEALKEAKRTLERVRELVDAAEYLSTQTCETCGQPGTIETHNGWVSTRCPEHQRS